LRIGQDQPLIEMMNREKDNSPADIFLTVDAGNLWYAASQNLFQEIKSDTLLKNIPEHLRDEKNLWFGLSIRARVIVYNTNKVKPEELKNYADLADKKWKGKLALRKSSSVYNQSLVAILIAIYGEDETSKIVSGWVNNLALDVLDNDTKVMEAISVGLADVGIVNTYYYGRLMKENPKLPLKLFFPDEINKGVHVNISGAGVLKYSKNKEESIKFLEWMTEENAQKILADINMEYPVNPKFKANDFVISWGEFIQCKVPLTKAGDLQGDAVRLMEKCKYK
jgi:iron(III) transport system substrate-binding protein